MSKATATPAYLDALHALHALGLLIHVGVGAVPLVELQAGVEDEDVSQVEAIRGARDLTFQEMPARIGDEALNKNPTVLKNKIVPDNPPRLCSLFLRANVAVAG